MPPAVEMVAEDLDDDEQRHRDQGADETPQPRPEGDRDEDGDGVDLQPAADDQRRDELAFDDVAEDDEERRKHGIGQRVEGDQRDAGDKQDRGQRADIGQEVERGRSDAPDRRVGHAERPQPEADDGSEPCIDEGDGQQIARDLAFDVVDHAQRALLFAEPREGLDDLFVEHRARGEQEERQHEGDGRGRAGGQEIAGRLGEDAGLGDDDALHAGLLSRLGDLLDLVRDGHEFFERVAEFGQPLGDAATDLRRLVGKLHDGPERK